MTNPSHFAFSSCEAFKDNNPDFDPRNGITGGGLTKREYFAAMAMQGLLAACAGAHTLPTPSFLAEKCVEFTDGLIEELNKPKP